MLHRFLESRDVVEYKGGKTGTMNQTRKISTTDVAIRQIQMRQIGEPSQERGKEVLVSNISVDRMKN